MPVQAIRPVQKWADDDSEDGWITPRRTVSVRTAPTIETPIVHQNAFSDLTPEQPLPGVAPPAPVEDLPVPSQMEVDTQMPLLTPPVPKRKRKPAAPRVEAPTSSAP